MNVKELITLLASVPKQATVRIFQREQGPGEQSEGVDRLEHCGTELPPHEQIIYLMGDGEYESSSITR